MRSRLLPLTRRDAEHSLADTLSEHVVFRSPVPDYSGRADVAHIFKTIGEVLDKIEVEQELVAGCELITIIGASRAHDRMSGVLHETYDALGQVERATLLLRPLSALLEAITAMRALLEQSPLPSTLVPPNR